MEREWAIPLGLGTNQKAELMAVARLSDLKVRDRATTSVRVFTDSAYAIGCLTQGWKVKANKELVEEVRKLVRVCASFEMRKVAGHSGVRANERADELAVRAAVTGEYYSGCLSPSAAFPQPLGEIPGFGTLLMQILNRRDFARSSSTSRA